MLGHSQEQVAEGYTYAQQTAKTMADIADISRDVSKIMDGLVDFVQEQKTALDGMAEDIGAISDIGEHNLSASEQAAAASHEMMQQAQALQDIAGKRTDSLKDGYYTAQAAEYNNGWKEFVTLCISNGEVVSVEYNAKNASGYIKSWDMAYMRRMNSIVGTYPNQYTRKYAADFLQTGDVNQIDAIAGASTSYKSFIKLLSSALENAKAGNSEVAIVSTDTGG